MSLTAAIVDDEYLAIKILQEYSSRVSNLDVSATFTRPKEALEFLSSNPVDLIFLDIQMPELSGFDLLKKLSKPPLVIFTTARHDYAVQAFDLDVLDYLVKPIPYERFEKAVLKSMEYLQFKKMGSDHKVDNLIIKADYRVHKIMTDTIEYIEGLGEYVKIYTSERTYVPFAALKELADQLGETAFVRIHKSFIISVAHIESYNHKSVQLKNKRVLPVGRSFKASFLRRMASTK